MDREEARNIAEKIQIELVARGIAAQLIDWMSANGIAKVVMAIEMRMQASRRDASPSTSRKKDKP